MRTKKKVKTWKGGVEDEGMGDERDLEELIHVARLAGERVRPKEREREREREKERERENERETGRVVERERGGAVAGFHNVWRSGYELSVVGDLLTKALAARTKAGGGARQGQEPKGLVPMSMAAGGGYAEGQAQRMSQTGMYSVTA